MIRARITRDGEYTKMPAWLAEECSRSHCEVCKRKYGVIDLQFIRLKQCCDHLFPVRFLLPLGLDPHMSVNIVSCCASCHSLKLNHETRIFAGDVYGFLQGLHSIGYPMNRVNEAAEHYGFRLGLVDSKGTAK